MSQQLSIKCVEKINFDDLEKDWLTLQEKAEISFFTSWSWINTWLNLIPDEDKPILIQVSRKQEVIALGLFSRKTTFRKKMFRSNGLYLHETGNQDLDQLLVEYNNFLIDSKYVNVIWEDVLQFLLQKLPGWNELFISGYENIDDLKTLIYHHQTLDLIVREEMPIYWADLSTLNNTKDDYLQSLSSNTRYQIRRSIRKYEEKAEIDVQSASSISQAIEYLDELKVLHQDYWNKKGRAGAFANPMFEKFHHALIKECLPREEVQLLKISCGDEIVGYLYNFVLKNTVYSYQSGLNYSQDKKLKPGLVSHYLAINHNLNLGKNKYDFLAGESQYKNSLSNNQSKLYWIVLQNASLMLKIEKILKQLKSRID